MSEKYTEVGPRTLTRVRFYTPISDPLYLPLPYPLWWSGSAGNGDYILITYFENPDDLFQYFPEAYGEDTELREGVSYSDRFPKPDDYCESQVTAERVKQDRTVYVVVEDVIGVKESVLKQYGSEDSFLEHYYTLVDKLGKGEL